VRKLNSGWLAGVAVLAAIAYALSLLRLRFSFPLLPFLSFDFAEIPDVLAYLLFGFYGGLLATVAHWVALNLGLPFHALVGPTMKLLAVLTTILGLEAAVRLGRGSLLINGLAFSLMFRTLIMAAATFVLYYYLFPSTYLPFSQKVLGSIGITVEGDLTLATVMVVFTSVFNILHVFLTVLPAYAIYRRVLKVFPQFQALKTPARVVES
jgi:riboflavin transporter FmnP